MNRKNYIDTKEQANRNVQYITYVKIIALVLLTVLGGLFVWQPKVSALTTSDIPGSLDTVIKTYDNGTQDCAGGVADSNNPVGCSDCAPPISREYGYYGWLSPAGDPTSMNTVTLPSGSTTLPLQFNLLTFLCHTIVNVDPNRPVNGLPYDGNPSDYAMTSSNFHFDSISVTNNANGQAFGTVTNSPVGGILAMGYPSNTNTRYWFTTTTPFNGGQSLPDATPITLSIPPVYAQTVLTVKILETGIVDWHNGFLVCIVNGQAVDTVHYSAPDYNCPQNTEQFTITINVTGLPPAQPTFVKVSGRTYNTQTGAGIPGGQYYSCMQNEARYDPQTSPEYITDMATTPDGKGYWLVGADGGVFTFGDAGYYNSLPALMAKAGQTDPYGVSSHERITGIASTPDGKGYLLVGSDGGVFTFGDAQFRGSMYKDSQGAQISFSGMITGISVDDSNGGYALVASDGGVFNFGIPSSHFYGAATSHGLGGSQPVHAPGVYQDSKGNNIYGASYNNPPTSSYATGIAYNNRYNFTTGTTSAPDGYWIVTSSGTVYPYGSATNYHNAYPESAPVSGIASTPTGNGYYFVYSDGNVNFPGYKQSNPYDTASWGDAFYYYANSSGDYQFPIGSTQVYCVRQTQGAPSTFIGPTLNSQYHCGVSYEWQYADTYSSSHTCSSGGNTYYYDLNTDSGLDFGWTPAATLSCGSALSGPSPGIYGQPFVVTVSFTANNGATSGSAIQISSTPSLGGLPTSGTISANGSASYSVPNVSATAAGRYTIYWTVSGGGAANSISCQGSIYVGYQPFISVLGGDIAAGMGYGSSCTPSSNSGLYGNNYPHAYPTAVGSGGQMASLSDGAIKGFMTALNADGTSSLTGAPMVYPFGPSGLAFANSPNNSGGYGGDLNLTGYWSCLPDYYGQTATTTSTPTFTSGSTVPSASNTYTASAAPGSAVSIAGGTLANGSHITLKVNGNVYISGNISYASYTNVTEIPRFELVTNGNIYIDASVTNLEGAFIAQGGNVYTCASISAGVPSEIRDYTSCKNPLKVVGALSASTLHFDRTYGHPISNPADGTPASAAEIIQSSPELWLNGGSPSSSPVDQYITSLPPVL